MSIPIAARDVQKLREVTGAAMMDCKRALTEAGGDFEKAKELIRVKGLQTAAKKAGRDTAQGAIGQYLHHDGKTAVLVEVNCETDFVARNEKFQDLARSLAMHVAAARPSWVAPEEVPAEMVEKEKALILAESAEEMAKKPEAARAKIVEGRLKKFFAQHCLLEQPFIKDETRKVRDLLTEMTASIGENVRVRRFARITVGE